MEPFRPRVVVLIRGDPLLPVLRHAGDRQIAARLPREIVEIVPIVRVQDLPRDAFERARGGNRALADRIEHKLGEIGTGVFSENPHHAAFEVLRDHRGGIAAAAVEPIGFATVGAELDSLGRHNVLGADPAEEGPFAIGAALQILDVAVAGMTPGEAHTELLIGEMAEETFVQLNQCAFAGRNVHMVDVEVTLIPRVVRDQQFAGKMARALLNVAFDPRSRRQRPHVAGLQIDPKGAPIFVAGRLAAKHDMSVVVHPDNRGADIAVGHRGDRARIVDPVERCNPEIEHAVNRRAESNPRAVPTDPHDASFGICEKSGGGEAGRCSLLRLA